MDINGDKLKAIREVRQLSMGQLAAASFVSRSYISMLERNLANNPSAEKIQKLCDVLKVTPAYLQDGPQEGEILKSETDGTRYETRLIGGRRRQVKVG